MHNGTLRRVATIAFVLVLALEVNSGVIAQTLPPAAGGNGPDIRGIRTAMAPQEVNDFLKGIDPAKKVTVGQLKIPDLLGDKPAVYAMAPDTMDDKDQIDANITFPPNAQQVWEVHRVLSGIPTTKEQIIASLRQKYGPENKISANADSLLWIYDGRGGLSTLSPADLNTCSQTLNPAILGSGEVSAMPNPDMGPGHYHREDRCGDPSQLWARYQD
jgi:hypothetical protein